MDAPTELEEETVGMGPRVKLGGDERHGVVWS